MENYRVKVDGIPGNTPKKSKKRGFTERSVRNLVIKTGGTIFFWKSPLVINSRKSYRPREES